MHLGAAARLAARRERHAEAPGERPIGADGDSGEGRLEALILEVTQQLGPREALPLDGSAGGPRKRLRQLDRESPGSRLFVGPVAEGRVVAAGAQDEGFTLRSMERAVGTARRGLATEERRRDRKECERDRRCGPEPPPRSPWVRPTW